jgi:hypothetical protein
MLFQVNQQKIQVKYPHARDKALAEIEPTLALLDDHSEQHMHMYPHPRDKALAETEPTAARADAHAKQHSHM